MFEGHDEIVERIARHLKQPVPMDPTLERRVMEAIAALPAPRAGGPGALVALGRWLATPRRVPLPPLAGVAAAGIAALLLLRPGVRPEPRAEPAAFQFLLLAPRAQSVSLVGDFNDWDPQRTPMRPATPEGVWSAVLSLEPGRYRYAFLIDGTRWAADPVAPRAPDDEFGVPSSVVTVGGS